MSVHHYLPEKMNRHRIRADTGLRAGLREKINQHRVTLSVWETKTSGTRCKVDKLLASHGLTAIIQFFWATT